MTAPGLRQHPASKRIASPAVRAKIVAVLGKRLQPADRDDVMQKVYLRLFVLIDRLPETEDGLLGLVTTVTNGLVVSAFRRKGVDARRLVEMPESGGDDEAEVDLTPEKREELQRLYDFAVEHCKDVEADAQCLRWAARLAKGDDYADIARDENIPEATIRKRMQRFREHMREHWKKYAGVTGAILGLLFFFFRPNPEPSIVAEPLPPASAPAPTSTVATETPDQKAAKLRAEAKALCDGYQWEDCMKKLDAASTLDPRNEERPEVVKMRRDYLDDLNAGKKK